MRECWPRPALTPHLQKQMGNKPVKKKQARYAAEDEEFRNSFFRLKKIDLTDAQKKFKKIIVENEIVFGTGPAGTAKTFISCLAALELLKEGKVDKIILNKPMEESGEHLGFLPGPLAEKMAPFMQSFLDTFEKLMDSTDLGRLINEKQIEFKPLAYMRGSTFDNALVILDECQNLDFRQLMLAITRMGRNTKYVVIGDVSQYDIDHKKLALPTFVEMCKGIKGVESFEFEKKDIMRNPILIEIAERYDVLKAKGVVTPSKK